MKIGLWGVVLGALPVLLLILGLWELQRVSFMKSDNQLIQKCLSEKLVCSIYINSPHTLRYSIQFEGFSKYVETEQEALDFVKKIEKFND